MWFNQIVSPLGLSILVWSAGLAVTASPGVAAQVGSPALDSATSGPNSTDASQTKLAQAVDVVSQQLPVGEQLLAEAQTIDAPLSSQAPAMAQLNSLLLADAEATAGVEQAPSPLAIAQSLPEPTFLNATPGDLASQDIAPLASDSLTSDVLKQVTSVDQLSDVLPTDWAYQALSNLIEQYGCLGGYPDGTFRGNRPLTRYEFAAGLNACLDAIATQTLGETTQEDLEQLQRLTQEFQAELIALLQDQVDPLESRIRELEANQFSTTTRLNILSSFNLSQAFAGGDVLAEGVAVPNSSPVSRLPLRNPFTGEPIVGVVDSDPALTFSHSTYLIFSTSFTGQDLLTTILAAGTGNPPASAYSSAGFTSTFGIPYSDSNPVTPLAPDSVGLFEFKYSFPLSLNLQAVIGPRILPFRHFDVNPYTNIVTGASGLNFYQSTLAGNGLSGAGGLLEWSISPQFLLRAGYLARNDRSQRIFGDIDGPSDPGRGLFNSTNSLLAELTFSPSPNANFRILYNRARLDAPPMSPPGAPPFPFLLQSLRGAVDDGFGGPLEDITAHNFVFNFDWTITPRFALFGRYSYSTSGINPVNPLVAGGDVNVQAFQLGMAFPDLGRFGAMGTVSAVVPFDVVSGERFLVAGYGDGGTQVDLLASYSFPVNDYISLVPMFFATLNPNNFKDNPAVYSMILRTQFLF